MKIALGADHGGFVLKDSVRKWLEESGHQVVDMGTFSPDAVDYPDYAVKVALAVSTGEVERGIMIDGAGIGSAMACNKVPGVRAGCCNEVQTAVNSVQHNNANVLTLGSGIVGAAVARRIIEIWISTVFEGGRHAPRVDKIMALEDSWRGVISADRIKSVVERVVRAVLGNGAVSSPAASSPASGGKKLITEAIVRGIKGGTITVPRGSIITPAAKDIISSRGINISWE